MNHAKIKLTFFLLVFSSFNLTAEAEKKKRNNFWYKVEWRLGRTFKTSPKFITVDEDTNTGYKLIRMGAPSRKDMEKIKELGITKIIVLSNDADLFEESYGLYEGLNLVVEDQSSEVDLTDKFLDKFDQIIKEAKEKGEVVAIRCQIGCHRTGRLAFYYERKYLELSHKGALANYVKYGFLNTILHPDIFKRQLKDLSKKVDLELASEIS